MDERLGDLHLVNLVVDANTVYHLKTIPCLISNPYCTEPPGLLSLRENMSFTAHRYAELFSERFETIESAEVLLSSVMTGNLLLNRRALGMSGGKFNQQ
jgi:hypothetical protein